MVVFCTLPGSLLFFYVPPPPNINNYNAFIVEWARIDVFTSIDLLIEMTKFNDTNQRLFTLMYTVRRSRWEGGGVGWGGVKWGRVVWDGGVLISSSIFYDRET